MLTFYLAYTIVQTQRQSNLRNIAKATQEENNFVFATHRLKTKRQSHYSSFAEYLTTGPQSYTVLLHNYKNLKIYQCVFVIFHRLLFKFTLHLIRSRNVQNHRNVIDIKSNDYFRNVKNMKKTCWSGQNLLPTVY